MDILGYPDLVDVEAVLHTYIHTYIYTYKHSLVCIHTLHIYIHTYVHTCIHAVDILGHYDLVDVEAVQTFSTNIHTYNQTFSTMYI